MQSLTKRYIDQPHKQCTMSHLRPNIYPACNLHKEKVALLRRRENPQRMQYMSMP